MSVLVAKQAPDFRPRPSCPMGRFRKFRWRVTAGNTWCCSSIRSTSRSCVGVTFSDAVADFELGSCSAARSIAVLSGNKARKQGLGDSLSLIADLDRESPRPTTYSCRQESRSPDCSDRPVRSRAAPGRQRPAARPQRGRSAADGQSPPVPREKRRSLPGKLGRERGVDEGRPEGQPGVLPETICVAIGLGDRVRRRRCQGQCVAGRRRAPLRLRGSRASASRGGQRQAGGAVPACSFLHNAGLAAPREQKPAGQTRGNCAADWAGWREAVRRPMRLCGPPLGPAVRRRSAAHLTGSHRPSVILSAARRRASARFAFHRRPGARAFNADRRGG